MRQPVDGQKQFKFELLTHFEGNKGSKPILQVAKDRFLLVIVPFDRTWIYDFGKSN